MPGMTFQALHERLRQAVAQRIEAGEMTGLKLAHLVGFQQAHISNFINHKRQLSMEGQDRVLKVLKISVLDLLDPADVNKRATILPPSEDEFENVLLVEAAVAATEPAIREEQVKEILKFKKAFLRRLKPEAASGREGWLRFALIKIDAHEGMSMYPRTLPGATLLLDRHYNSLKPYRKSEPNIYAVRNDGGLTIKYVELAGENLVLRPHNQSYPVAVQPIEEGKTYGDYIVGRVCHVAIET
ncbi:MAG: XRE family transcriptional regulator [Terriglobales bacterium]